MFFMSSPTSFRKAGMALLALGIVFGDIGTSPLYAFGTALGAAGGGDAIAVASLILWTLFLVVMVKYGLLVMRASYEGEGGIFALMALLRETDVFSGRRGKWLAGLLVFGAALLFGDGAITPVISVLSAVEGAGTINPDLEKYEVPVAAGILAVLFLSQRFGTGRLGFLFGPVMLVWFLSLAVLGGLQVWAVPEVLGAFNPVRGFSLLFHDGWVAAAIVGAVVLAVTGAEALYADMGHFGRPAILGAWRFIVFPSLMLNYLGQAALVVQSPAAAENPNLFFLLAPLGGWRESLVVLATVATVIASQALISGVFSLTGQAIDLGYFPRFFVKHTSPHTRGQIYIPLVNYCLGAVCLLLLLGFRSSESLANAYGVAVTGAMAVTSVAFCVYVVAVARKPAWVGWLLLGGLLAIDLPLFLSCMSKVFCGGMVPLLLACGVAAVMLTWKRGRTLVHKTMSYGAVSPEELGERLENGEYNRSNCTQVFIVRKLRPESAIANILEQYRRVQIIGEQLVILLLDPGWRNPFSKVEEIRIQPYQGNLWIVTVNHGFMVEPDVPEIVRQVEVQSAGALWCPPENTFYIVWHELVLSGKERLMPRWQCRLYAFLSRNVLPGLDYLGIPPERLVILNWMFRI